jgi:hypothetical protein
MSVVDVARLFALKSVWRTTGLESAGRALLNALDSPKEDVRTVAGMFLVQAGKQAEPLVEEGIKRRVNLPMTLVMAGDIGAVSLKPELQRFASDPDPAVAKAAQDGLRILERQVSPGK